MVSKRTLMVVGAIVILAIVLMIVGIDLFVSSTLSQLKPVAQVAGPIGISATVIGKDVATYNNAQSFVEYGELSYSFTNATAVNFSIGVYRRDPIFNIYLVNAGTACYECLNISQLYTALAANLSRDGILRNSTSLQLININNISATSPNSLILLSTGFVPAQIMPNSGLTLPPGVRNVTLLDLFNRGDSVLYVGDNFSFMRGAGVTYQTPNATIFTLHRLNLITQPYAKYASGFIYNLSSFNFLFGQMYGASAYQNVTNGELAVFSRTPQQIWKNASAEAQDLSKAIVTRYWMAQLGTGGYLLNQTNWQPNGRLTLISSGLSGINMSSPYVSDQVNATFALIRLHVSNDGGSENLELPFRVSFRPNGTMGVPAVIGYGNVVPIRIKVNTVSSSKSFSIEVSNRNLSFAYAFPLSFFNTSLPIIQYYPFGNLSTNAYYIASLVDINDRSYGKAVFYVPSLNITLTGANWSVGQIFISVNSSGTPLNGAPYSITLNGAYPQNGTIRNGLITYALPAHAPIQYGSETMKIIILNKAYTFHPYDTAPAGIPSIYIEFGAAAVVILLLNVILRAPNREQYFIDAPELPPVKKTEVTIPGDNIVNLFETINYHYHWRFMPLTPEEIKSGISTNIRSGNTPLSITLQNTNEVLYHLADAGKLVCADEYYMPAKWVDASKHDIEYLIIFRKLRDFLVEHALFFTDLDANTEADMVITTRNKQVPVFIYSSRSGVRKLPVHSGHKIFVVFLNGEAKQAFEDDVYGKAGKKTELLRMALENNAVELIDAERLDELLY